MRKNRIKGYWMLLMSLLLAASAVLSVGTTQARLENTVTSLAVLSTPAKEITSNCLVTASDVPRTVLLGEADLTERSTVEVPFWLLSAGTDTTLSLSCYVEGETQALYFDAVLKQKISAEETEENWNVLEPGAEVNLIKDIRQELMLCVTPTELARGGHEDLPVNIYVMAGESLKGTFQIILPEAAAEEPAEPEIPTEPETPEEPETPTEPETPEEPEAPTEPEIPAEPEEPTEPEMLAETEESTELETPEESEEPTESAELTSLMTLTESEEPTEPETEIEITTENESESVVEESSAGLKTLPAFDITQQLPMIMTLEGPATSVRLGVQKETDEGVVFEALPDYTMYSVDGGTSCYMVYGDYILKLVPESTTIPLLLDFSYTDLTQEELTLAMEVYLDGQLQTTCTAVTAASVKRDWQSGPILDFENTLEFTFPEEWKDAELTYTVEYLTMTDEQGLQYIPAEFSEEGLQAIYDKEENNHRLELSLGENFTRSGTYRLLISWSYEGLCYNTAQTNFFVNCSRWVVPGMNGSEVSDDE